MFVCDALESLRALWEKPVWTAEDVAHANAVADCVRRLDGGPQVEFDRGKAAGNQAGLEEFVRFLHASVRRPERRAAMISTLDDGPFAGLPVTLPVGLLPTDHTVIEGSKQLRLYVLPDETALERHVLVVFDGEKQLWARLVSSAPRPSVKTVKLGGEVSRMGPCGWAIDFWAQWAFGYEHGVLYLDADGGFLFYFLSG